MRMDTNTLAPLSVVDELFEKFVTSHPSPDALGESADWGVAAHFDKLLSEGNMLQRIPSINFVNPDQLAPNSVVKFRCMIQDMFDPEYYIGVYEQRDTTTGVKTKKTGKYADQINFQSNVEADMSPLSPSTITYERQPFLCVPIPGETKWVKDTIASKQAPFTGDDTDEARANLKRSRDEEKPTQQTGKTTMRSIDYTADTAVIVAVYDLPDGTLKLNDTLEVVGILAPHQPTTPTVDEDMLDVSSTVSTLPRIHCLTFRVITNAHPVLGNSLQWKPTSPQQTAAPAIVHPLEQALQDTQRLREVRQQIISYLSTGLGGDTLAAEYLLLFLLSKVYQRHGLLALGKLSLNLSTHKMNKQHDTLAPVPILPLATTLRNMCASLVPRCGSHAITLERLNRDNYIPKKDYTTNRLMPALLQLSEGTLLIIDETTLNLNQTTTFAGMAKQNLAALNDLSQWQKLEYDFVYHKGEFMVDIPVLTVSSGKPLLSVDCTVTLNTHTYCASVDPPADIVELWRVYLSMLRNKQIVSPGQDVTSHMENDFVQARQQHEGVTQDSFHLWLTLARLSTISFGEEMISIDRWAYIRRLDEARVQRETV